MIVFIATLFALAVGPFESAAADDAAVAPVGSEFAWATSDFDACCSHEIGSGESEPCAPGDDCPPGGGCCGCVSCTQRVASEPEAMTPDDPEPATPHGASPIVESGASTMGAVWHPPRG